ncbi:hypothetical protein [Asticcacaulis sp. AND118]|uniref:hypothetical protein n=1 Tax=Asticcacaulis sp. AND118 TaxID=2840468 RepID=UPI001CFFDED4|nr:hypothetical protein [Asticcacaulis sp. AND118]UDF03895.1 hypothetical protein LH365_02310 [Asticcacaulis sp. AND118]
MARWGILTSGLMIAGLLAGGHAGAQTTTAQPVVPPSLQGSFLTPEAPLAPKIEIDPALIGMTPRIEGTAAATVSPEDKAAAARKTRRVALYKQLMEANGTSKNVRLILANTKAAVKMVILERKGATNLSAADELKFNQIADRVLKEAEVSVIDQIAAAQSASFSEEEILTLISANSGPVAAKYNASKFANPEANAQQIQSYMVEAVVKIIKTFKEAISG